MSRVRPSSALLFRLGWAVVACAAGCSASHRPEPGPTAEETPSGVDQDVGFDPSPPADNDPDTSPDPESPPSADRARESATHSYCDRASGIFGVYLEDLKVCWNWAGQLLGCDTAAAFDEAYLLDARAGQIKGTLNVEILSDDALYAEGSLDALEGTHVCNDLAEYIFVAVNRTDSRIEATVFDDRSVGGGIGFSRSNPDCVESVHDVFLAANRLDFFAFASQGEFLRGPTTHSVAEDGGVIPDTTRLVDDCDQLLGYLAVLYDGDTLLTAHTH